MTIVPFLMATLFLVACVPNFQQLSLVEKSSPSSVSTLPMQLPQRLTIEPFEVKGDLLDQGKIVEIIRTFLSHTETIQTHLKTPNQKPSKRATHPQTLLALDDSLLLKGRIKQPPEGSITLMLHIPDHKNPTWMLVVPWKIEDSLRKALFSALNKMEKKLDLSPFEIFFTSVQKPTQHALPIPTRIRRIHPPKPPVSTIVQKKPDVMFDAQSMHKVEKDPSNPLTPLNIPTPHPKKPTPLNANRIYPTSGDWYVQIMTYLDEKYATQYQKKFIKKGYPTVVVQKQTHSKLFYYVRLGGYKDRQTANQILKKIKKEEKIVGLLVHPRTKGH